MIIGIFYIVIVLYVIAISYFHFKYPEMRWDWNKISTDKISFPQSFI
ncbi:uncharacterized protein METZ01_LOCUS165188, partial [marine metagenome]